MLPLLGLETAKKGGPCFANMREGVGFAGLLLQTAGDLRAIAEKSAFGDRESLSEVGRNLIDRCSRLNVNIDMVLR
jgi:hypothetical protein